MSIVNEPDKDMRVTTPSGMTVERAQRSDAAGVEVLLDAAAAWQESRGIDQWRPGGFGPEIRETLAEGELFVARREGAVVGCFMLEAVDPELYVLLAKEQGRVVEPGAHLARLAVARAAAGRGVGIEMLEAGRALTAKLGLAYLRLQCPAGNHKLRRYYEDAGFAHCGDVRTRGPNGEGWVVGLYERSTDESSA